MTPFAKALERRLPRPLAWLVLVICYTGMLIAVVLTPSQKNFDIAYVDVQGQ